MLCIPMNPLGQLDSMNKRAISRATLRAMVCNALCMQVVGPPEADAWLSEVAGPLRLRYSFVHCMAFNCSHHPSKQRLLQLTGEHKVHGDRLWLSGIPCFCTRSMLQRTMLVCHELCMDCKDPAKHDGAWHASPILGCGSVVNY